MLHRAVLRVQLPLCWQRGAGGRYQQVLTAPKKHPLQAVSSLGSPMPRGWAGAAIRTRRETSACPTLRW